MNSARNGMYQVLNTISSLENKGTVDSTKCHAAKRDAVMAYAPIFISFADNYFNRSGWGGNNNEIQQGMNEIESLNVSLSSDVRSNFTKFKSILAKYVDAVKVYNDARNCTSVNNIASITKRAKALLQDQYIQRCNQSSNLQESSISNLARNAAFNHVYHKAQGYVNTMRKYKTDSDGNIIYGEYTLTRNENNTFLSILEEYPDQYRSTEQTRKINDLKACFDVIQ